MFTYVYYPLLNPVKLVARFTLGVGANVQTKSSIPISAKVEISPKGFLYTRRSQGLFNLPKVTNKC